MRKMRGQTATMQTVEVNVRRAARVHGGWAVRPLDCRGSAPVRGVWAVRSRDCRPSSRDLQQHPWRRVIDW